MGLNEYFQIGSRIKAIRKDKGLSQRAVAAQLGIPFSTYSNYENDNREPSLETLHQIAKILAVPLTRFLNEETADEALASEEALQYRALCEYLDELEIELCPYGEEGLDHMYIDKAGETIGFTDYAEALNIYRVILVEAEARKERYILNRLRLEFENN